MFSTPTQSDSRNEKYTNHNKQGSRTTTPKQINKKEADFYRSSRISATSCINQLNIQRKSSKNDTEGTAFDPSTKKNNLYKTEVCDEWRKKGSCVYGSKCTFSHGICDRRPRLRVGNYKTLPCCDPVIEGRGPCPYGKKCSYAHPGEAIRRPMGKEYYDKEYFEELEKEFGDDEYPFGFYI
eukprot:GAHX01001759.1.p1 GENE.GAHX01001759.1~~GAHX01001759.1.p1  ORF type:complete len:181 (-),score=39.86 GAHX01001759.1:236-778(-)